MEPRISIITLGVAELERSLKFYRDGMGLPTTMTPETGIIFFKTNGTILALYPKDKLAEDVGPEFEQRGGDAFSGVTLAHNTCSKDDVDSVLAQAEKAGGKIEKPAQDVFWGGYSGYFSDPDGHLWEVAYSDQWKFNEDGNLVLE
jgi:catechol 2,3-dioxygenase-like lactoylglutathione lyase family enzyme